MRITIAPETWLERLGLMLGIVPCPILDTFQAIMQARAIMAATQLGVFEALGESTLSAESIANQLKLDVAATEKLLGALVSARYLRFHRGCYSLTRSTRKWLLKGSPNSIHDYMLFRYVEWEAIEQMESYVSTGEAIDAHEIIEGDRWNLYQNGMRAVASLSAEEIVRRLPLNSNHKTMLDVGGAHGQYSLAACRRVPGLYATVFELPQAIDAAKQAFDAHANDPAADRVSYQPGDALSFDFTEEQYDLIFVSQLVHHFTEDQNRDLIMRLARALKSGGALAIADVIRPTVPGAAGQSGQMLDLFFAITSRSGTWSVNELQTWQAEAGLRLLRPRSIATVPGLAVVSATKQEAAG